MKTLRQVKHIPFGIPLSSFLIKIGARTIKTEAELILKSRNVIPKALMDFGFQFQYPTLKNAIQHLIM